MIREPGRQNVSMKGDCEGDALVRRVETGGCTCRHVTYDGGNSKRRLRKYGCPTEGIWRRARPITRLGWCCIQGSPLQKRASASPGPYSPHIPGDAVMPPA